MLRLPRFRMVEPTTWTEAAALLREHGAAESDAARGTPSVPVMLVAGGTDLFPNMKRRQFAPQVLVSLGRVKGAREISNGSLRARGPLPHGLNIAAGTQPGSVVTLRGHGMPHLRSGVRGNLHAHVDVVVPSELLM